MTTAWSRLSSPPASIAATTPSHGLPVDTAVEKPATAPISIIPSTPRLRTPGPLGEDLADGGEEQDRPARDPGRQDQLEVASSVRRVASDGARTRTR